VIVAAPAETPPEDERLIAGANPLAGATVVNLSPASAQQYGADPFGHGVLVTAVGPGIAQSVGLRAGDFVRQVNGQPVTTTRALADILSAPARGWSLMIQRGDQVITARFGA
jgi:S1-C subfamily serine protease